MRKAFLLVTLVLFVCFLSVSADDEGNEINIFGGAGFAFSDIEGLCQDAGVEFQLSENIYIQGVFDYYLAPYGSDIDGDSAYGINLYGVYKIPSSDTMNFYLKAGGHYTTIKMETSIFGIDISGKSSDFGIAGGAGVEFAMGDSMDIYAGGV
ncbi:MAG: porin family protein, partial [bacterium]|nr:porin family protein [bacterium]